MDANPSGSFAAPASDFLKSATTLAACLIRSGELESVLMSVSKSDGEGFPLFESEPWPGIFSSETNMSKSNPRVVAASPSSNIKKRWTRSLSLRIAFKIASCRWLGEFSSGALTTNCLAFPVPGSTTRKTKNEVNPNNETGSQ